MEILKKLLFHRSPPQTLALGFLITILMGTILLSLPYSTHAPISLLNAFFTATSATTVTGLVVLDTGADFTRFGQVVIMTMMQIGGIGLMTFTIFIVLLLGKKIGLKDRLLVQESFNQHSTGGMVKLVKLVFIFAISMELLATIILSIKWVPEYGWGEGLFTSLFHAVSAFNNAVSLWSDSLTSYKGDPLVNIVITFLFITGGIGFTVIYELISKRTFNHLSLHTKVMLVGTLIINVIATLLIFSLEYLNPNTLGSLPFIEKIWSSYFQAVTPRTAGFNSLDTGSMETSSLILTMVLMFIGAGSASTGSGIKLTTFLVTIIAVISYLRGRQEPVLYERTLPSSIIVRSLAIIVTSFLFVLSGIFLLSIVESASLLEISFEAFSAFGTVGLSMGLTSGLSTSGKLIICLLMFIGRIGPVTFAFALAKADKRKINYPKGDIFTG
ncbi:TrkH family potassium uptake protein [Alkalicoccobacillus plakortidis]|uniref:TrkH family potassium uptake protein n=1 Tax=Alkalicoccobacillus plakortidis TaxID=444060 RepID=A0ABT0XND6_9BACI|nr:TrkH family potassium uptake protein [Alkalicoccobacillus plakortidis]MCM2677417.1 TrkH family potassium uptake protein [Alkalicoccobacillus plakortidis]